MPDQVYSFIFVGLQESIMTLRYFLLSMLLFPLIALAATSIESEKPLAMPLQALKDQGFEFKAEFQVDKEISGYVVEYQGQGTTVFLTPDQQHAIVGNIVDNKGNNLSSPQIEKYVYQPMSQQMWMQLEQSNWIGIGSGSRIVYAFFDPFCPYCYDFWQKAKPWIESNKVQMRILLVGIIRKDSGVRAAALIQAADPVKALIEYENSHWKTHPADPKTVLPDTQKALQNNLMLMETLGSNATPSIYYQDKNGRLHQQLGVPPDAMTMESIMDGTVVR